MSDSFDNNEEDRGYETELNFNDLFGTIWSTVWMIPITIVFILMIKNKIDQNKNKTSPPSPPSNKTNDNNTVWILGFIACLCLYLRDFSMMITWIFFITTFDYSETSGAYISHTASYLFWMTGVTFLYLFFICRLYVIYNPKNQSMVGIKIYWYAILLFLNFIYFISLGLIAMSWIIFDVDLYVINQSVCLALEIVMYITLVTLFSQPMWKIILIQQKNANKSATPTSQDILLKLLVRMNILSSIALLSTIVRRIFDISSYLYCPDECWLTYINYCLLAPDSFINIFCILCSFKSGQKIYDKWCKCLHNFILGTKVNAIEKKINEEMQFDSANTTNTHPKSKNSTSSVPSTTATSVPSTTET